MPRGWPTLPGADAPRLEVRGEREAMIMVGSKEFRRITAEAWDPEVRLSDMDADDVDVHATGGQGGVRRGGLQHLQAPPAEGRPGVPESHHPVELDRGQTPVEVQLLGVELLRVGGVPGLGDGDWQAFAQ